MKLSNSPIVKSSNGAIFRWRSTTRVQLLHGHDFFVLGGKQFVEFLDELVVQLLQFELGIFLIVLAQAVLDGFLQFVLHIATHIAHFHLGLLTNFVALLHQFLTALLCGLRNA